MSLNQFDDGSDGDDAKTGETPPLEDAKQEILIELLKKGLKDVQQGSVDDVISLGVDNTEGALHIGIKVRLEDTYKSESFDLGVTQTNGYRETTIDQSVADRIVTELSDQTRRDLADILLPYEEERLCEDIEENQRKPWERIAQMREAFEKLRELLLTEKPDINALHTASLVSSLPAWAPQKPGTQQIKIAYKMFLRNLRAALEKKTDKNTSWPKKIGLRQAAMRMVLDEDGEIMLCAIVSHDCYDDIPDAHYTCEEEWRLDEPMVTEVLNSMNEGIDAKDREYVIADVIHAVLTEMREQGEREDKEALPMTELVGVVNKEMILPRLYEEQIERFYRRLSGTAQ